MRECQKRAIKRYRDKMAGKGIRRRAYFLTDTQNELLRTIFKLIESKSQVDIIVNNNIITLVCEE